MDAGTRSQEFVALGHAGSEHYAGLETFPNPGVSSVEMTSDELAALCPITMQPDLYVATIEYFPDALCLESKSVKLYLGGFAQTRFDEIAAVRATLERDLTLATGGQVAVELVAPGDFASAPIGDLDGKSLNELPVAIQRYQLAPELLGVTGPVVDVIWTPAPLAGSINDSVARVPL